MGVEVTCKYVGDLSVSCSHGPSKAEITTTAPVDNGGTGDLFSPTDLVATALGSCTLTIMGKVAKNSEIDIKGAYVKVVKDMNSAPRRIGSLMMDFYLPSHLSDKDRKKMENAAKTCPVKPSLHPEIEVSMAFNYNI